MDAQQGFSTIYIPSISYALPTTSIAQQTLQTIQRPVTTAALSSLGFNTKMPSAVVYASKFNGVLGITDLYSKQVNGQIKLIISHL
jgi:hypothetical protein